MEYFFILGSNPALSLAELSACLGEENLTLSQDQVALYRAENELAASSLINSLGGTIKIGNVLAETRATKGDLISAIMPLISPSGGKFNFGFSGYGVSPVLVKPLAMSIKKELQGRGTRARWVVSKEPTLSSVVVEQNRLTRDGAEFVLIARAGKILVGKTLAVQPFKELSRRDYGRPARDDRSGMLPPKLAQIMINLARVPKTGVLLDPFCGSSTILTEAALMGYTNLIGSDISDKAIADSKKNLDWIIGNCHRLGGVPPSVNKLKWREKLKIGNLELHQHDSTNLSALLGEKKIDAIVTEPYLGPQRGKVDTRAAVEELETLYAASLKEFYKILKVGGRIVMIWPIFITAGGRIMLSQKIVGDLKIVPPFTKQKQKPIGLSDRQTIIYGRPGQKVWREIVILEK